MEILKIVANNVVNEINVSSLITQIFELNSIKTLVVSLNQEQLFVRGVDSEGKTLGKYAASTRRKKIAKGLPDDHVTLFDTGEFYQSMELIVQNEGEFIIIADPIKGGVSLFDRYGNDITGLTQESLSILRDEVLDLMRGFFLNQLFKGTGK